jgi:hypothetical protein
LYVTLAEVVVNVLGIKHHSSIALPWSMHIFAVLFDEIFWVATSEPKLTCGCPSS